MYSLARLYSIFNCRFQDRPHLIAPPGGTESDDKLLLTGLLILLDTFFFITGTCSQMYHFPFFTS